MKLLFSLVVLLAFVFTINVAAQEYFTDLYGFRLKQYRETALKEFGTPFESEKTDDGFEYDAFMLKPDGALYMVFKYAPDQTDIIWSIQITGTDTAADLGFRATRFGMTAAQVEKQLGSPTNKVNIGEYGTRWEYNKSNFSVEINTEGKLSSIRIKDISDEVYPTPDLKKIPHFDDVLKVLTSGSNGEIAEMLSPDMELYHAGTTVYFQKSLKNEIAADYSKIFATIRELAKELKAVNHKNPTEYEENGRLTPGQSPKHVMKFKRGGKLKEIVFKYEWGEFLMWEFNAGKVEQGNWDAYVPRTLKEISTTIAENSLKKPDIVRGDPKKDSAIVLSYNSYQSRVKVVYTGESRKVSPQRKEVIDFWLGTFSKPKELLDLYENEYLFTEDGAEYWLPVQKTVAVYFSKELKKGNTVTLFVAWLGGRYEPNGFDHVFLVNEFEAVKSEKGVLARRDG